VLSKNAKKWGTHVLRVLSKNAKNGGGHQNYIKSGAGPRTHKIIAILMSTIVILIITIAIAAIHLFMIMNITDQMCYFTIMQHFSGCHGSAIFRISSNKNRKLHQFLSTSDAI
jgi:uncharacterized membrane protein YbaN (DUF454 family)